MLIPFKGRLVTFAPAPEVRQIADRLTDLGVGQPSGACRQAVGRGGSHPLGPSVDACGGYGVRQGERPSTPPSGGMEQVPPQLQGRPTRFTLFLRAGSGSART